MANLTLQEARELAQQGIKMTHKYFTSEEYITMKGNMVIFEDGVEIMLQDWATDKPYLLTGWSKYQNYD